jgi:putative ATPase
MALGAAKEAIASGVVQQVPVHLRDKGGQASKRMGHGEGYEYSHGFPEAISGQEYLEKPLKLYTPGTSGAEAAIAERLGRWRALKAERRKDQV